MLPVLCSHISLYINMYGSSASLLASTSWTKLPSKPLIALVMVMLLFPSLRCNPISLKQCNEVHMRCQPFRSYIENPCVGQQVQNLTDFTQEQILSHRQFILNSTLTTLSTINRSKDDILKEMEDAEDDGRCVSNHSPHDVTVRILQDKEKKDALLHMYGSLLVHVSRVHYAYLQEITESSSYNKVQDIIKRNRKLIAPVIDVTCKLEIAVLSYPEQESEIRKQKDDALDMNICDNKKCGKKYTQECFTLLDAFGSYLQV